MVVALRVALQRSSSISWQKYKTFLLSSNQLFPRPCDESRTHRFSYTKAGYRYPINVYGPDEFPDARKKPRPHLNKLESTPTDGRAKNGEDSSSILFSTIMADIEENRECRRIALEGIRLIEEGLLCNLKMEKLFILKTIKEIPEKIKTLMSEDVGIHRVSQKHMDVWTHLTTPPGFIGIFRKPSANDINNFLAKYKRIPPIVESNQQTIPVTLVCDNLREPGNLGSILRSAAGVGCKQILLSKGCVDPWDGKVLRGGSGAQFRIPISTEIPMFALGSHIEIGPRSTLTLSNSSSPPPLPIIGIFIADNSDEQNDESISKKSGIPSVPYASIDYTQFSDIFLLVGGESEGIGSATWSTLAHIKNSLGGAASEVILKRIHIPLRYHVESLNVANAFGIIIFEIRRQFDSTFKSCE